MAGRLGAPQDPSNPFSEAFRPAPAGLDVFPFLM
ncbi:hypothetical protein M493_14140 [Geobacillus genomosp. 3]|uniref:Uncharacterized protein n=1 Tax=Geobacillus genomosp. 3 TaxID=1921421 RepID=S5Z894_GEOG3|nr:hypothetical protein M493_14140 [Geobacillus genomosp. 3]